MKVRGRLLTSALLASALAATATGLVTAQESELPPIPTPPEETTPLPPVPIQPSPASPDEGEAAPPSAEQAEPAPYRVLGPDSRRAEAEAAEAEATAPPPEVEEEVPVEPGPPPPLPRRPRHAAAIVQALDKVTAETLRFEVGAGRPVRWKSLVFKTNACETEAANEPLQEAAAHLVVTSEPPAQPGRTPPEPAQVFRGWMFASSPGLNPFEHPVYDVWLVGCRKPAPAAPAAMTPPVTTGPTTRTAAPRPAAPRARAQTTAAAPKVETTSPAPTESPAPTL